MATFRIPYLVVKPLALGGFGYYWQPSPALAKKGWKGVNLGASPSDNDEAKMEAAKRRNAEVDAWRAGGAAPRTIKKFTRASTVAALVEAYQARDAWEKLAKETRANYQKAIDKIEIWATDPKQPGGSGNMQLMAISRDRVAKFRDGLMKPIRKGGPPRHYRAHNTLRVLRTLMQFAVDQEMIEVNPAVRFGLATPAPRHQIWEPEDVAAVTTAAIALGYPNVAFGIELAEYTAQRIADVILFNEKQWREIKNLDRDAHAALAGADGKVMGIFVRQGKTKRWVGIPVAGELRGKVEAALAANAARKAPRMRVVGTSTPEGPETANIVPTTILVDDRTGRPWLKRWFQEKVADACKLAVKNGRPEVAGLHFHDLRRTAIVRMGELGLEDALIAAISGHMLGSIKAILETYMPRTNKMAARAIVARIGDAAAAKAERDREREKMG